MVELMEKSRVMGLLGDLLEWLHIGRRSIPIEDGQFSGAYVDKLDEEIKQEVDFVISKCWVWCEYLEQFYAVAIDFEPQE